MLSSSLTLFTLATSLISSAMAMMTILAPGGTDLWWVAGSTNTLVWNCNQSDYTSFNVFIANSNTNILTSPLPLLSNTPNYNCPKSIVPFNLPPATGYTIQITNILNSSDIYVTSQPFELKANGSAYPASSATPAYLATSNGASSSTGTGTTSTSTSNTRTSNGVSTSFSSVVVLAAIVAGLYAAV